MDPGRSRESRVPAPSRALPALLVLSSPQLSEILTISSMEFRSLNSLLFRFAPRYLSICSFSLLFILQFAPLYVLKFAPVYPLPSCPPPSSPQPPALRVPPFSPRLWGQVPCRHRRSDFKQSRPRTWNQDVPGPSEFSTLIVVVGF